MEGGAVRFVSLYIEANWSDGAPLGSSRARVGRHLGQKKSEFGIAG